MAEQRVIVENAITTTPSGTQTVTIASQPVSMKVMAGTDTLFTSGSAASPTAGTAICTLTTPAAGFYLVEITHGIAGTGSPQTFNNAQFRYGSQQRMLFTIPEIGIAYKDRFYINVDGTQNMSLNVGGNVPANLTVAASIAATRMN